MSKAAVTLSVLAIVSSVSASFAQDATICSTERTAVEQAGAAFKPQFDHIQQEGQDLKNDADKKPDLAVDVDVKMAEQHWAFDLPSVTMRDQRMVVSVPQVTMHTKDMSFDLPEMTMVMTKTGQYPEFTCDHAFIPSCTVHWHDILTKIPQTTMVTHHISMDIPDVTMADTSIVMGIPEFKMDRQDWYVKIPEFTLKNVTVAGTPIYNDYSKRGDAIKSESADVANNLKSTLLSKNAALFTCLRQDLATKKAGALAGLDASIASMTQSINQMQSAGGDPSHVTMTINDQTVAMPDALKTLQSQRDDIAAKFTDAASQLDESEKAAAQDMTNA